LPSLARIIESDLLVFEGYFFLDPELSLGVTSGET
jgi:hypothetical protein